MQKLKNEFEQNGGSWKEFKITDIFDIKNTHSILSNQITPNSGTIPYVTAGESNNSISTYIAYDVDKIEKGNSIMIGGKTLVVTYQEKDYFSNDSHNLALYLKDKPNVTPKVLIYMVSALNKSLKPLYTWGNSISKRKIQKDIITLPTCSTGTIDYSYMERYISELEEERISELAAYLKVSGLQDCVLTKTERLALKSGGGGNLRKFKIGDLFNIESGIRLTKAEISKGDINFLGAIATNNGIREKIKTTKIRKANCITVNYNGSVGEAFYQPEPFFASDDVKVYRAKGKWIINELNALFLATAIKTAGKAFCYSQKWSAKKMKYTYISLPVRKTGEPDYEFMETYIRALEKVVIKGVVDWKDRIIKTTKEIVYSK